MRTGFAPRTTPCSWGRARRGSTTRTSRSATASAAGRRCASCSTRGPTIVTPASRVADEAAPTLVVIGPAAPDPGLPAHVAVARVELDADGRILLPALLDELARRGVGTLLVEGGPVIAGAFLQAGLVDEVVGYVRAAVLGAGRPLLDLPGVTTIGDLRPFRLVAADVVGEDVRIRMTARAADAATTSGPAPAADLAPAEPPEQRPRS